MAAIAVDHVQCSVPDLTATRDSLQRSGWQLKFEERPFARGSRPYFRGPDKGLVFLTRGGAALECIDGSPVPGPATWTPEFIGPFGVPAPPGATLPFAPPDGSCVVQVEALASLALVTDGEGEPGSLSGLVLASKDPAAAGRFLGALGFRPDPSGEAHRWEFPAGFVGMGLKVRIVPRTAPVPADDRVDDLGTSLVALISRDLAADLAQLRADGVGSTDIHHYRIAGRSISNAILEGPGGELVELIQIGRD